MITGVCVHCPSVSACPSVCVCGGREQFSGAVSPSFHLYMGSRDQPGVHCQHLTGLLVALYKLRTEKQFFTFAHSIGGIHNIKPQCSYSKCHCNYSANLKHSIFRKQEQSCGQLPCDYQHQQRVSTPVRIQAVTPRANKTSPGWGEWPLPKTRVHEFRQPC